MDNIIRIVADNLILKYCVVYDNSCHFIIKFEFKDGFVFTQDLQEDFIKEIRRRLADKFKTVYVLPYYGAGEHAKPGRFFFHLEDFQGEIEGLRGLLADLGLESALNEQKEEDWF